MKVVVDLSEYGNRNELLKKLTSAIGMDAEKVHDLDLLYENLVAGTEDLHIVFTNKLSMTKEISVFVGMLHMTIEEAMESRKNLTFDTYYYEEGNPNAERIG